MGEKTRVRQTLNSERFQDCAPRQVYATLLDEGTYYADLEQIQTKDEESIELSRQAQVSAEGALQEIDTRRLGMVVAPGVILITRVALALIKRELDRDLEEKRALHRNSSP